VDVPFNDDLAQSAQFLVYVESLPILYPLKFRAIDVGREVTKLNKLSISSITLDDNHFLNLRFFDGSDRAWYDSLNLPHKDKSYVAPICFTKWLNRARTKVTVLCNLFSSSYSLNSYDVFAYVILSTDIDDSCIIVTPDMRVTHPALFG
jgi:hypothetical protein